ncbi:MAG: hypothetical protein M3M84_00045 [Thermoproteota archaeon]|nr:hypothetical protein [Thermoproteota archaeon]
MQLRNRIINLLQSGSIADEEEKQKLEFLLKTKKWNPYCIRRSAITSDSDFVPEYALKKKVKWSMIQNREPGTSKGGWEMILRVRYLCTTEF